MDLEDWRDSFSCDGWGYADVLPYFRRMESAPGGATRYRGGKGPLRVTTPDPRTNVLNAALIEAGRHCGYPLTDDYNGQRQEGFAVGEQSILGVSGAAPQFPISRPRCAAGPISPSSPTAWGRAWSSTANAPWVCVSGVRRAMRLCSRPGARSSTVPAPSSLPHLLMLSGVGPAAHLRSLGIDVVQDRPAVGKNLQDHPDLVIQFGCRKAVTLRRHTIGLRRIIAGLQWFASRRGIALSNQFEVAAYLRTRAGIRKPGTGLRSLTLDASNTDDPLESHPPGQYCFDS